jgi:hypothetical protein
MSVPERPAADYLYAELTAVGTPPQGGLCAGQIEGFPDRRIQQAVYDGEVEDPDPLDVARRTCRTCPVLADCHRFADDSLDETTFLAGMTAAERSQTTRRPARTRHRKAVVLQLRGAGVTVPEIAFYTQNSTRSIEADMAEFTRRAPASGRPRMRSASNQRARILGR